MRFLLLILLMTTLFFACTQSKNEYYSNGMIHLKYEKLKGNSEEKWKVTEYDTLGKIISISYDNIMHQMEGLAKYFDENGNLKAIINFKNGKKNGECIWYHQNGQVKTTVFFVEDQRVGKVCFYNEDGSFSQVSFYRIINGIEHQNGVLIFDEKGKIITQKSVYAEIVPIEDTFNKEFIEYRINWVCSEETYVRAFTGKYDENFNLLDSATLKYVDIENINVFYPKSGIDTLRIIFEFKEEKNGLFFGNKYYLDHIFY